PRARAGRGDDQRGTRHPARLRPRSERRGATAGAGDLRRGRGAARRQRRGVHPEPPRTQRRQPRPPRRPPRRGAAGRGRGRHALLFIAISSGYVFFSLALGLYFSATSSTAAEAVQKTVLFSIPLVQLSGFAFPTRNMPFVFRWLAEAFPATHYIRVSRAIYLRAAGPEALAWELTVLALSG